MSMAFGNQSLDRLICSNKLFPDHLNIITSVYTNIPHMIITLPNILANHSNSLPQLCMTSIWLAFDNCFLDDNNPYFLNNIQYPRQLNLNKTSYHS